VDFTIVTPSFRNSKWLKLCIASVADQEGVTHEHIVQDAGSDDGTLDWLPKDSRVQAFVEKDKGMYDAVNRGYRRAKGELLAYINCDEQYLPGTLAAVKTFFSDNPDVEVVLGDCIVVDPAGNYLCDRRSLVPQFLHTRTGRSLSFLTAATFIRRTVIHERNFFFSTEFRDLGDVDWTLRLIRAGIKMKVLPRFLSVFTETGVNMNLGANAAREARELFEAAPAWVRALSPLALCHYRLRRLTAGHYSCKPHQYALYTVDSPDRRKTFDVTQPTFKWTRWKGDAGQPAADVRLK
jgi:glycosyltransferase involved in cell wall biosynthesis